MEASQSSNLGGRGGRGAVPERHFYSIGRPRVYVQSMFFLAPRAAHETLHMTQRPDRQSAHGVSTVPLPRVSHTGLAPFRRCVGRCGSVASPNRSFGRSNVAKTSTPPSARATTLEYGCVPLNVQSMPLGENAWPEMAMASGEVPLLPSYVWAST